MFIGIDYAASGNKQVLGMTASYNIDCTEYFGEIGIPEFNDQA